MSSFLLLLYPDISSSELFVPAYLSTFVFYISGMIYNMIGFFAMPFTHFIVNNIVFWIVNKLERKKVRPCVRSFVRSFVRVELA